MLNQVIEITTLKDNGATSKFDVMLILIDTADAKIVDDKLLEAFNNQLGELSNETDLQVRTHPCLITWRF